MRRVVIAVAGAALCGCHHSTTAISPVTPDSMAIRRDIEYLASPALAGRLTGTAENDSAAAYLARRYQALGLRAHPPTHRTIT